MTGLVRFLEIHKVAVVGSNLIALPGTIANIPSVCSFLVTGKRWCAREAAAAAHVPAVFVVVEDDGFVTGTDARD